MTNFLFWNINHQPLQVQIANLARAEDVDVIILAESSLIPSEVMNSLNKSGAAYRRMRILCEHIELYARFDQKFLKPIQEENRFGVYRLSLPLCEEILLVAGHLESKRDQSSESQALDATEVAWTIREVEAREGTSNTILVGDLNMNPFEMGLVGATAFNAVMDRRIAARESRVVHRREYPFFYNPMWSLMGDLSPGPPGTHYRGTAEQANCFWNMYDQVLLRPGLISRFDPARLKILEGDSAGSFLGHLGHPHVSDHLPICFTLRLEVV